MTIKSAQFDPRRRIGLLALVFLLLAGVLVAQLTRLQILDNERYVAWGMDQRLRTTPLLGERGDIVDRNGEEFAISLPAPVIYADPSLITDPIAQAAALAPIVDVDAGDLQRRLAAPGRFSYVVRPTTESTADEVRKLGLPGVFVGEEPERFRPNGPRLARGLLGTVGVDNVGLSGLEAQYDDVLTGKSGLLVSERGIAGRSIPEGERERLPAVDGADIRLTIDRALQFEVERALITQVAVSAAKGGVAIIADPATGEVLAMASVEADEDGSIGTTADNRALTWVYEPASVMKAITFSAVINERLATPETTRVIQDSIDLYEETFTDEVAYGSKSMSITEILVRSSNTGTITWARDLGARKLYEYMLRFGFRSDSGLGFPGESSGILADVTDWPGTHIATVALGQSIAVTPMQMLSAYNVIANDGIYVSPRLVGAISSAGEAGRPSASVTRRVIDTDVAVDITAILARVVESGTARLAQVPGYAIAAKTGTARKVQESGGYFDSDGNFRYIATVVGFFPAQEPQFSMIVIIDEPTTDIFASRVAAPLFGELAAWTLRHYQVSPTGDVRFADDEAAALLLGQGGT